ncbi:YeeE/YedE family protein [Vibrio sp. 10N.286.49.B3]|uniref:YeeE/YedE family protein n=1 Tax=Vibrio sp. 10N.286.49.B3 TaxID=1880855 RepID=UPI0018E4AC73|nr:YeeE/YedE family protein [Vibrio sp. 10N.286.49.B3]
MKMAIPWDSLFGGVLLGISATILLLFNGKIAGISGILSGLLTPKSQNFSWQLIFILGLVAGGTTGVYLFGLDVPTSYATSPIGLVIAGLLVGLGTRIGNGCTSGHGICGIGRGSKRSIVATMTFMLTAAIVVFLRLHIL